MFQNHIGLEESEEHEQNALVAVPRRSFGLRCPERHVSESSM
jgi:hypothetical protein